MKNLMRSFDVSLFVLILIFSCLCGSLGAQDLDQDKDQDQLKEKEKEKEKGLGQDLLEYINKSVPKALNGTLTPNSVAKTMVAMAAELKPSDRDSLTPMDQYIIAQGVFSLRLKVDYSVKGNLEMTYEKMVGPWKFPSSPPEKEKPLIPDLVMKSPRPTLPPENRLLKLIKSIRHTFRKDCPKEELPEKVDFDPTAETHLFLSSGQEEWPEKLAKKYKDIQVLSTEWGETFDPTGEKTHSNHRRLKLDNSNPEHLALLPTNGMDRIEMRAGLCFCQPLTFFHSISDMNLPVSSCAGILSCKIKHFHEKEDLEKRPKGNMHKIFWVHMIRILNKDNSHAEAVFTGVDPKAPPHMKALDLVLENAQNALAEMIHEADGTEKISLKKVRIAKKLIKDRSGATTYGIHITMDK